MGEILGSILGIFLSIFNSGLILKHVHLPIMQQLCQHNTLTYYAYYYAGIFDSGLVKNDFLPTRDFDIL